MGAHEQPVLERLLAREKEQEDSHKSVVARDCLEIRSMVQRGDQRESSFLPGREHKSCAQSVERGWYPLQESEQFFVKKSCQDVTKTEWQSIQNTSMR